MAEAKPGRELVEHIVSRHVLKDSNLQPPVLEFSPVFCVWLRLVLSARFS